MGTSAYEKLVNAAKRIDELCLKQEERTKAWAELARDARKPDADRVSILKRRNQLDASGVIDFSDAVQELRIALRGIKQCKN